MRSHLDLLILLQRVWGGFGMITAASLAVLAAGLELALVQGGAATGSERGAVWILLGCAAIVASGAAGALAAARFLRLRATAGRAGALLLAVPNLILVPFGTALGVYTFWALLNDDARREFGRPPRGPGALPAR